MGMGRDDSGAPGLRGAGSFKSPRSYEEPLSPALSHKGRGSNSAPSPPCGGRLARGEGAILPPSPLVGEGRGEGTSGVESTLEHPCFAENPPRRARGPSWYSEGNPPWTPADDA